MGLFGKIKGLFEPRRKTKLVSSNISVYNTTLVYIPEYSELSEAEKKIVESYIVENNRTNPIDIILYGETIYNQAKKNTELLWNLYYGMTAEQENWKVSKMSDEEVFRKRLEEMITIEELELYKKALQNLEKNVY